MSHWGLSGSDGVASVKRRLGKGGSGLPLGSVLCPVEAWINQSKGKKKLFRRLLK